MIHKTIVELLLEAMLIGYSSLAVLYPARVVSAIFMRPDLARNKGMIRAFQTFSGLGLLGLLIGLASMLSVKFK